MQNFAKIGDFYHYSLNNIFIISFIHHQILQHKNYSFLYLIVLVKSELSMQAPMGTSKYFKCFLNHITNINLDQIDLKNNHLQWKINFCQELCFFNNRITRN